MIPGSNSCCQELFKTLQ